jgi:alpha-ketoglutarate-dependent taurine dioxygenase
MNEENSMIKTALEVSRIAVPGQQQHHGDPFPLALECQRPGVSLETVEAWLADQRGDLLSDAERCGAMLFRGFPLQNAGDFDRFVSAFGMAPFTYEDSMSNAVRVNKTPRVFTANEAPPTAQIFFHHEMAQTPYYPKKLFFFCERPADSGGATPLCRSDILWERLSARAPRFAADCAAKGLRYTNVMPGQNDLASGMGRSWQSTLKAATPAAAEERLRELNYSWEWLADGSLKATTPHLSAVHDLPSGRRTFFNQLIAAYCGWKDARNDPSKAVTHGDGTPLDRDGMETVVRLAEELAFDVPWQAGDVALVDNYLAMHARRPFTGTRKVLAAMI